MDSDNVKQHFRPDEAPFIDQVQGWLATATNEYRPVLTDFMNPRQCYIAQTLTNRQDEVNMASNGGWNGAEMRRLLFYPRYYQPLSADFDIQLLTISYPVKFTELHHRQVLGTLMSAGIKRTTFGDILHQQESWQLLVDSKMTNYLRQQVTTIGRVHVKLLPISFDDIVQPEDDWEELTTTVSSLRVDSIVAAAFNYSRNRAKTAIERGFVRVNWEEVQRPDYSLAIHDRLSVRHAGRIRVNAVNGITRKGKIKTVLNVIKAGK
ncbi:MAG: RNA-binding protein [[Lactobacillus] timonensis]|nr:RNA-binding protein [[Lactobacillus] timonensis]